MVSSSESFQGIRIYDGNFYANLRIYVDRLELEGSEVKTFNLDTTEFHEYLITGQNSNILVYVDGNLAINGTGIHTNQTVEQIKALEFGDISGVQVSSGGEWDYINYSVDGSFSPGDISKLPFITENIVTFSDVQVVAMEQIEDPSNGEEAILIGANPFNQDEAGRLYLYSPTKTTEFRRSKSVTSSSVNAILIQDDIKYIGTEYGLNQLEGEKAVPFDKTLTMTADPESEGFESVTNLSGTIATVSEGILTINVSEAGHFYYKQDEIGDEWVEGISNEEGWTFETRYKLSTLTNSSTLASGVVLNDGTRTETVQFGPGKIKLKNSGLSHTFTPTSDFIQVRITGKNDDILVYLKKLDDTKWTLVIDGTGKFTTPASKRGTSQFPDIAIEDSSSAVGTDNKIHMVWHDNQTGIDQVYHSFYDGDSFSVPVKISSDDFSARQPSIAIDSLNRRHVVYQSRINQHVQVMYVLHDGQTWNAPVKVTDFVGDSENPKVKTDSGNNVHVVWQDTRFLDGGGTTEIMYAYKEDKTGKWFSSANPNESDTRITTDEGTSVNPAIEINSLSNTRADGEIDVVDEVFVAWQSDQLDSRNEIYSTNFRFVRIQTESDSTRSQESNLSIEGYWDLNGSTKDGTTNFYKLNNASATFATALFDSGAVFDSSKPSALYANADAVPDLDITEDFTVLAWVKPDAIDNYTIVSKRSDDGVGPYSLELVNDGGTLKVEGKISGTNGSVLSSIAVPVGVYSHIGFRYATNNENDVPELSIFINKEEKGTKEITLTKQDASSTPFVIGGTPPLEEDLEPFVPVTETSPIVPVLKPMSGIIDDVFVFKGALSRAEIAEIADNSADNLNDVNGKTGPILLKTENLRVTNHAGKSEKPHLSGSKFTSIANTYDKINLLWQDDRDRTAVTTDTRTEIYHAQYDVATGKWSSSGQFSVSDTRVTDSPKQSINPKGISTPTKFVAVWQDDRDKADNFNIYEAVFTLSTSSWESSGQGEYDIKIDTGIAGGNVLPAVISSSGSELLWIALQNPKDACDIAIAQTEAGDYDEEDSLSMYFPLTEDDSTTTYDNIIMLKMKVEI